MMKCIENMDLELPKGILLSGPPGTGKTSLVRALSEEAGCEFMAVSAAEFADQFVGAGAQKVRDLFKEARQKAQIANPKKQSYLLMSLILLVNAKVILLIQLLPSY